MEERIAEIHQALENNLYQSALTLALTIPDICGQIEYTDLINPKTGKRLVGKQYRKWFRDWVEHYYADVSGWTVDFKYAKNPRFTAEMCYELRCSFLHSGNSDVNDDRVQMNQEFYYSYNFELCVNGTNSIHRLWSEADKINNKTIVHLLVRIEVIELCKNICRGAKQYYDHKGWECFEDKKIKLLDINKEWKKISQLNRHFD